MALQDSYLSMIQQCSAELNLAVPQYAIGNLNQDVIQLSALMLRSARELVREYEWMALDKDYYFYTQYWNTTGDTTAGSPVVQNVQNIAGAPASFLSNPTYYQVATGSTAQTNNVFVVSIDQTNPLNVKVTMNQNALTTTTQNGFTFSQQIYDLPSDYQSLIDRTQWDSSRRWQMLGPATPQEFQWLRQGYISTGPRIRYKLQQNKMYTWPAYATNERIAFEYRGNSIIVNQDGITPQTTFLNDNDLVVIDEMVLIQLTKLRYWQIKGFDTADLEEEYKRYLSIAKALDSSAKIISFAPSPAEVLISYQQIPDAGFGS